LFFLFKTEILTNNQNIKHSLKKKQKNSFHLDLSNY
jgi:hypothetical protein